jgi:hypothetical protein
MAFCFFEPSLKLTQPYPCELDRRYRLDPTHLAFGSQRRKQRFSGMQLPARHQAANRTHIKLNLRRQPRRRTLGADRSRRCVPDLDNDMCPMAHTREMANPVRDRMPALC